MLSQRIPPYVLSQHSITIMSIATLKRKTQVQYNNMSVGAKHGFSLNGTHRSQGYVGQTSLSRSLPQTLMKGHGGCCGKYPNVPVVQSAVTSLNDPAVVKPSVVGTQGMINTHYRWMRRPAPFTSVKPDNNTHLNDQSDYITRVRKAAVNAAGSCNVVKEVTCHDVNKKCFIYSNGGSSNIPGYAQKKKSVYIVTKPESDYVAMSSGEHIEQLHKKCSDNDIVFVQSSTSRGIPFACGGNEL